MKSIPQFIYGTAWKEGRTAELTLLALENGFRAIDTANQRKHYFEAAVGEGLQMFLAKKAVSRDELFLQTKFTFARGQDHRKPYNESDPFAKQVNDSFASSLEHLGVEWLDSYVLHGPYGPSGLGKEDWETWGAMEELHRAGKVRALGISNVSAAQLEALCSKARVKPLYVQNRCYARRQWDAEVRTFCRANGIHYQGFSLLTANPVELSADFVQELCAQYGKTVAQITFRFCRQIGILPLTGTSSALHMREDLQIEDFELTSSEVKLFGA